MATQNKGPFIEVPDGRGGVLNSLHANTNCGNWRRNKPITEEDWLKWRREQGR